MMSQSSRHLWILTALAWSLSAAFADVAFSLLPAPADSAAWSAVARLVLGDLAIFAALFGAAATMAMTWPVRWLLVSRMVLAMALASAGAGLLILGSPYNRMLSFFDCRPEVLICRPYATTFLAPILGGSVLLILWNRSRSTSGKIELLEAAPAIIAAPVVSAIVAIVVWFFKYSRPDAVVATAATTGIGLTVVAARWAARSDRGIATLAGLIVVIAMFAFAPYDRPKESPSDRDISRHVALGAPRIVLLITIDALRADALSCYGQPGQISPHIDALANESTVFENAMSPAPWTAPAISSLMTALDPLTLRIDQNTVVSRNVPLFAQRMADAGYYTSAAIANDLIGPDSGLARGFDEFRSINPSPPSENGALAVRVRRALGAAPPEYRYNKGDARVVTAAALAEVQAHADAPLFLWLHYLDVHAPYAPPPAYLPPGVAPASTEAHFDGGIVKTPSDLASVKDLYERELRYVDENVGRVIEELRRLKLYDAAVIIVSADHGDQHWEHGQFAHGPDLYDEVLRVPLIIKTVAPSSASRVPDVVSTGSLLPTTLDLVHAKYDSKAIQYQSLAGFLAGGPTPKASAIFSATGNPYESKVAVFFEGLKYIESIGSGRQELFDLGTDPREQMSIASVSPSKVDIARKLLAERRAASNAMRDRYHIVTTLRRSDPETLRHLKALGYLQ